MAQTKNLPIDASNHAIQVASTFLLQDATGTPQVSPLAYTTGEINLVVPSNAMELVIRATTDLRIKTTTSGTPYYVLPANTAQSFPVNGLSSVYFIRDSASGTANFYFTTL